MSSDIYQEQILDHYRHPRNHGTLEHPDASFEDSNPLCGDVVAVDCVRWRADRRDPLPRQWLRDQPGSHLDAHRDGGRADARRQPLAVPRDALLEEIGVPLSPARSNARCWATRC